MHSIKTKICHINVSEWFPPNDPIATSIARLCVLREDLYLELRGTVDEPIPPLDECSADWREIHFFRNSVRTLLEIRSAIETLKKSETDFASVLSLQPAPLNGALQDLSDALEEAHTIIKKLRNEVGGHLSHQALGEALQRIAPETSCLLQMGDKAKEIHYKFALEFIGATMLRHVEFVEAENEWEDILSKTYALGFKAISSIDMLFVAYSRIRNLSI